MPTIGFEIKRKCKVCGKVFVVKTLDSHYCSPKCGKVAWHIWTRMGLNYRTHLE